MARRKATDKENPVKATQAEAANRVNVVYSMLLIGSSRADILQHAAEKWQIEERTTDDYIAKATAILETKIAQSQDIELNRALQRRELLFLKNMKIQDYKAALAVEADKAKLLSLYPATKHELIVNVKLVIEFVQAMQEIGEDAESILRRMIEKARQKQDAPNIENK